VGENKQSKGGEIMEERKNEKRAIRGKKKGWTKPTLEDVSGKVMAQPYIRFT
tara:strand:- start:157 stop:312 length:156 start_codon:yes stop_codon:yes gene_type:complete